MRRIAWGDAMTRAQRAAVVAALNRADPKREGGRRAPGWTVCMTPTTGPPRLIWLTHRNEFGRVTRRVPVWDDPSAWAAARAGRLTETMRRTLRRGLARGTIMRVP